MQRERHTHRQKASYSGREKQRLKQTESQRATDSPTRDPPKNEERRSNSQRLQIDR